MPNKIKSCYGCKAYIEGQGVSPSCMLNIKMHYPTKFITGDDFRPASGKCPKPRTNKKLAELSIFGGKYSGEKNEKI